MTDHHESAIGDPHDMVPGYLLDALEGPDLTRFLDHLTACAPCQAEVAQLQPTVADLATAAEVIPPANTRDRLDGRSLRRRRASRSVRGTVRPS